MGHSKRKILLIENQQAQFDTMFDHLELYNDCMDYEVYPQKDKEYIIFIDHVRVWVNTEYKESYNKTYRDTAFEYINKYIIDNDLELILMDYILGGAHDCKKGTALAKEINKGRPNGESIPVLFISKAEHTDKNRIKGFDEYKNQHPNTNWVFKGYFGDEILNIEYFEKEVIGRIKELLGKSLLEQFIELLEERRPKSMVSEESYGGHPKFELNKAISDFIEKLNTHKISPTKELFRNINNLDNSGLTAFLNKL